MPSRKIEVQLVGDASDLERSLAGALAALKAFGDGADKTGAKTSVFSRATKDGERGLINFDRAAAKVNKTMSGGPLNMFDAVGNVGYAILKMGGIAERGTASLGRLFSVSEGGEGVLASLGSTISGVLPAASAAAGGLAVFAGALVVLPAIVAAATFVLVALLDTLTTLAAIAAAAAGPVTVLGGLLGGLGAAFAYVATQSLKNQATQKQVHDNLLKLHVAQQTYNDDLAKYGKNATQTENALIALHKAQDDYATAQQGVALGAVNLSGKFHTLIATLSRDFQPELLDLAKAAGRALTYLDRLAHMPLEKAFKDLSTRGVALMSKFVYGVANVLKKPFTLAVQIAFGSGGQNAQTAITSWWDSLTRYLFGYTETHPVKLAPGVFRFETKQVDGALKPIQDWFNKQHFTRTGLRWAGEIIDAFTKGPGGRRLSRWASTVAGHAGHQAGRAFRAALSAELSGWFGSYFKGQWQNLSNPVAAAARQAASLLRGPIMHAWDSVKGYIEGHIPHPHLSWGGVISAAQGVWDRIVSYIESHIPHPSIHISIPTPSLPSLPSWLHPHTGGLVTAAGGLQGFGYGGLVTGPIRGRDSVPAILTPGETVRTSQQEWQLRHDRGGGGETHIHLHGGTYIGTTSRDVAKSLAALVSPELSRIQARRA